MKKCLNSNHLKLIAIIAMTIDHAADLLFPNFQTNALSISMHLIGRITAPIMWFFICEGFFYTKNIKKYLLRMGIFAIISHFAYCFAFGINFLPLKDGIFNQTSVIWPLFWSIVTLWIINNSKFKEWIQWILVILICIITFPSDWSCIPVMAIAIMYSNRGNVNKQTIGMMFWVIVYALVSFFFVNKVYALIQLGVILVYPLLKMYNGEKGKANWMKWLFYFYYPAHLILVGILRLIIYGDIPLLF